MESLTLDREVMRLKDTLVPEYAALVYRGHWFSPEREVPQEMIDATQRHVTVTAHLKLHRGTVTCALYSMEHVTFEKDDVYDQAEATGFMRLNALRLRLRSMRESKG